MKDDSLLKKIRVGIIFGGKSAEHEVSLQSAKNVIDALDKNKYEAILIGIDKTGKWFLNDESKFLLNVTDPKLIKLNNEKIEEVALAPESKGSLTNLGTNKIDKKNDIRIDIAFPILHGPFGEDGTMQGLLKLAGIPFVGAGVLGSAVGMDKEITKRLLRDAGINIGKFLTGRENSLPAFMEVVNKIGLPFFVKPANMGSSVGINKVKSEEDFEAAVQDAFKYDRKILFEEFIPGREIECSVLGNDNPIASVPGEIISNHDFYSYEAKYIDESGAILEIPAKLSEEMAHRIQDLSVNVFRALECEGLARVDFFVTEKDEIFVNEINTMPGFTKISMYPKLWEASGISYSELIDKLIELAMDRFKKEQKLQTSFK
ncbi:MAG: D-alanine--D-alanine ligase [Bacteroidetes bacterium]|nr:D-alanine--D-alanine ligase [Bacteroidota bacterium]